MLRFLVTLAAHLMIANVLLNSYVLKPPETAPVRSVVNTVLNCIEE